MFASSALMEGGMEPSGPTFSCLHACRVCCDRVVTNHETISCNGEITVCKS